MTEQQFLRMALVARCNGADEVFLALNDFMDLNFILADKAWSVSYIKEPNLIYAGTTFILSCDKI